jgi:glucosamine--fructose-6-phosphate aminotransferase (isomerizing)
MRREIEEIPRVVRHLLADPNGDLAKAGEALRASPPVMIATIARGSSDHAAAFLKYAIELTAGVPVASIGPSVTSVYGRDIRLSSCAAIAISQSGKSPDIVAAMQASRRNGALTIALTNTPESPLAWAGDLAVDLLAGEEHSVAATKSFVNSIVAGLAILAHWQGETDLLHALERLPEHLQRAVTIDWPPLAATLKGSKSLYVLGRGPSLAIASEVALKLKETCGVHAEAYSSAEVLHGPSRIVEGGFPILALAVRDAAEAGVVESTDRLSDQGAAAFVTSDRAMTATPLPFVATGHPFTDALALAVTFYSFVEQLSRQSGFDPDRPPHLKKITETT